MRAVPNERAAADRPPDVSAGAAFRWNVRVYYEDTDAGGIVYYANFLKFFERCRTEWLRACGVDQHAMATGGGVQFVVTSAQVDYLRPARLDDELLIEARIVAARRASLVFGQGAWRDGVELARGRVAVAAVDVRSLAPVRLPDGLLEKAAAVAARAPGHGPG